MPTVDMIFVVRFQFTPARGSAEAHAWYKRVRNGREGIELRDRIVSLGTKADDRILVTECKCIPLTNESKVAA